MQTAVNRIIKAGTWAWFACACFANQRAESFIISIKP